MEAYVYDAEKSRTLFLDGAFSMRMLHFGRQCHDEKMGGSKQMHVVIVSYGVNFDEFDQKWEAYVSAYAEMYARCPRFVLVFDLRNMRIPPIPFLLRKIALIKEYKCRTTCQVRHACVLVQSDFIANLVTQLLTANRQAAPVTITTSLPQLAAHIVQMMYASDGTHVRTLPVLSSQETPQTIGVDALQIAIIIMSLRFICHFLARIHCK